MENEIKNAIPVTVTQKQMKYFDINLIKHDVLDVYPDSPAHNTPETRLPLHSARPAGLPSLLPHSALPSHSEAQASRPCNPTRYLLREASQYLLTLTMLTHQEVQGPGWSNLTCSGTGSFTNITENRAARFVPWFLPNTWGAHWCQ